MSKILLACLVFFSLSIADELKMKDVNKMLYEAENKILIIDKKDLKSFIAEHNKKGKAETLKKSVPEEVFLNLDTDSAATSAPKKKSEKKASKQVLNKISHKEKTEMFNEFSLVEES